MSGNLTPDTTTALFQASQTHLSQSAGKLNSSKTIAAIEKTSKEFEAVFISAMMKPMFEGTQIEGAFGGGKGEEIFQGMIIQEYGTMMSRTGGIGIADDVKAKLIELQGLKEPASASTDADITMDAMAVKLNNMKIGE